MVGVLGGERQEGMRLTKPRRAGRNQGWVGFVAEANTRQVIFFPNDMTLSLLCQSALSCQVKVSSTEPSRLFDELKNYAYAQPEPPSVRMERLHGAQTHDCHSSETTSASTALVPKMRNDLLLISSRPGDQAL